MDSLQFPFDIKNIENNTGNQKLVKVDPQGYVYPNVYRELGPQIYNFELRSDDIFLVGFPRSGTTWCQETIWLINNNLDYDRARSTIISDRFPLLDLQLVNSFFSIDTESPDPINQDVLEKMTSPLKWLPRTSSPRFIKSHLPLSLLPPKLLDTTKVYVARDPRDVAVSLYNFAKLKILKNMQFDHYWDKFSAGNIFCSRIFKHIKEAWEQRNNPNLFFLMYEDMSKDLPSAVRRLSEFFDKQYSEEQIRELCDHLSFDKFKTNKAVNRDSTFKAVGIVNDGEQSFVRKGKVRGWEDCFSEELKIKAERWMTENLAGTDLPITS